MLSLRSSIAQKLLSYFFLNQKEERYVNELAKILDVDPKNLDIKLKELELEGLFASEFRGQERYYFLNDRYFLLNEYKQIVLKIFGLEGILKESLSKVNGVKEVYIFGSYASDKLKAGSDLDLLVIGDHDITEIQKSILSVQRKFGRDVNVVNMSKREFAQRKVKKDAFLDEIFKKPIIRVV